MKKVHLICNAHIDPIWQWDWQEGASVAISTFQSAVNLAKDFDYIFCHNEVTLYKYIEEYAPKLFDEIKELVKAGKWHIMGGWYLQPDCTMPSGESFVRQILMGHRYFKEKFGVAPKTAINLDPFGHTRGLVQIVSKCGQDSYMSARPFRDQLILEDDQFIWVGFDGSKIKYNRITSYGSPLGESVSKIKKDIDSQPQKVISSFWGVGNHGGGPSRIDLKEIDKFIKEVEKEGIEVIHSTPENFFAEINPSFEFNKSVYLCMPGCYVSMSKLKRLHIKLENNLYFAEKIASIAELNGVMKYPHKKLDGIAEDLLNAEFHDVLPGSSIQSGEENGIMLLHHGLLDAEKVISKAFFALSSKEKPAKEGEYPVIVFNPHPYEYETNIECEFTLADPNYDEENINFVDVLDEDGNILESQITKEESNINLDWRKRVVFKAVLKPMALSRFTFKTYTSNIHPLPKEEYVYTDDKKYIEIDKNTGLLKSFCVDGKEYIHDGFCPIMFDDNPDPWGMSNEQLKALGENPRPFILSKNESGIFSGLKSVQVIENGPIYLGIEAFFEKDNSKVRVEYRIYKNQSYVDVNVTAFWQDNEKLLRIAIPVNNEGKYIGQTAFGIDDLFTDGRENVSHRFVAVKDEKSCLAIFNNSTYGSMYKDNTIYLSLLRSAGYCVHPILERQLMPTDRHIKHMDLCEHQYSFRIAVAKENELERMATEFNQKPFVQNVFPVASEYTDEKTVSLIIENTDIVLVTMKKSVEDNCYIIRLMNNSREGASAKISIEDASTNLTFGKFEVKTVKYDGHFTECNMLMI